MNLTKPQKYAFLVALALIILAFGGNILQIWRWFSDYSEVIWGLLGYVLSSFWLLVKYSLWYFWPPLALYIVIGVFVEVDLLRRFSALAGLSAYLLYLRWFWDFSALGDYPALFPILIQIYLLLLWVFPQVFWNALGFMASLIQAIIVYILPDLPSFIDDLGMIHGFLAFVLLYLNNLALVAQNVVDSHLLPRLKQALRKNQKGPS